jgi:hypothetical protein
MIFVEPWSTPYRESMSLKIYLAKWPIKKSSNYPNEEYCCYFSKWIRISKYSTFKTLKKKILFCDEFKNVKSTEQIRVRKAGYENREVRPYLVYNSKHNDIQINDLFKDDDYLAVQILENEDKEQKIKCDEKDFEEGKFYLLLYLLLILNM